MMTNIDRLFLTCVNDSSINNYSTLTVQFNFKFIKFELYATAHTVKSFNDIYLSLRITLNKLNETNSANVYADTDTTPSINQSINQNRFI